ncbi:MAG: hypothetical protein K0Q93_2894 [Nocardioidaceae bacterium]|nr:hypothetical protein [Nocardioidaceae bacterium]
MTSVVIDPVHRGPTSSGNGGWTAGVLAAYLPGDGPVTVTLRRPPPLARPLEVRAVDERALLLDDSEVVAEAATAEAVPEPVSPVAVAEAQAAEADYAGLAAHPFPECFVCGTERAEGDGLRLRPGPVEPGRTACTWVPHPAHVEPPHLWAALDCPGGWTNDLQGRPMVLGRITAVARRQPRPGERLVVVGALLDATARKSVTATTVYDTVGPRIGSEIGSAVHTWIQVDPRAFA